VFRDAVLVAAKDLRVEARSRVIANQVLPLGFLVLVLFAFAIDPDSGMLARAAGGLFWIAVLFAALLALQRAFAIESADANRDALRLSGLDGAGIFVGKAAAVGFQLVVLEALLLAGLFVLYGVDIDGPLVPALLLLFAASVAATGGLAAAGTLYAALAAGLRVRETLLPLLLLPVLAPVLIGATRAFESALQGVPGEGWPWVGLLALFGAVYTATGLFAFGALLEES
jgi:heme exporter protein B